MVGQSLGKLCFRDPIRSIFYVCDVQTQVVEQKIPDVGVAAPRAYIIQMRPLMGLDIPQEALLSRLYDFLSCLQRLRQRGLPSIWICTTIDEESGLR